MFTQNNIREKEKKKEKIEIDNQRRINYCYTLSKRQHYLIFNVGIKIKSK